MGTAAVVGSSDRDGPLVNPWPWMIAALAALGGAFLWAQIGLETLTPIRILLVFLGIVAAGIAVAIRPASSLLVAAAGAGVFTGCWALYLPDQPEQWNSFRIVLAALVGLAGVSALILLLPRTGRRIVVCCLIVLHFGGILSAVFCQPPPIWLAEVGYKYLYRPYLQFMYLTNAYHFYAPEPGPAFLFWFDIEYTEEGQSKWHWEKVPNLDSEGNPNYPLALQYQRRVALCGAGSEIRLYTPEEHNIAVLAHARANWKRYQNGQPVIPRNADPIMVNKARDFGPPSLEALFMVRSYIRHVAEEFQHDHPQAEITGIKLYRFEHHFLSGPEFARGEDPQAPRSYIVYYWGEYEPNGAMKTTSEPVVKFEKKDGKIVYAIENMPSGLGDGYLYWQLPYLRVHPNVAGFLMNNTGLIPKPPREPALLRKYKPGDVLDAKAQLAFSQARERFFTQLALWDAKVDQVFLQGMQIAPAEKAVYLEYICLHAGDPNWVLYPGDSERKPR